MAANSYYLFETLTESDILAAWTSQQGCYLTRYSVISTHYSGGLATVVKALSDASLDIGELESIYKTLTPIYPYWQNIGLLLEKMGKVDDAHAWEVSFKNEKKLPFL